MKTLRLYGFEDRYHEADFEGANVLETQSNISIVHGTNVMMARFTFDGDWGVELVGIIPHGWKVRAIKGDCSDEARRGFLSGSEIVIHMADDDDVEVMEVVELQGGDYVPGKRWCKEKRRT